MKQKIILSNKIILEAPVQCKELLMKKFTISNSEFQELARKRKYRIPKDAEYLIKKVKTKDRWTSVKVFKKIKFYKELDGNFSVPRGGLTALEKFYKKQNIKLIIINKRYSGKEINLQFHGELLKEKGQSIIEEKTSSNCIIQAPTGSGKTVMALYKIAKLNRKTLIVVHTVELMNQWKKAINQFLKIPVNEIGQFGQGKLDVKDITVGISKSVTNHPIVLKHFNALIIDECHIAPTQTYFNIVDNYCGEYVIGLSATPRRSDGKTKPMKWLLGEIELKVNYEDAERTLCAVKRIFTEYKSQISFGDYYSTALAQMCKDEKRNRLIANTIIDNIEFFGIHLILSSSSKHLYRIYDLLPNHIQLISKILIGEVNKTERKNIVKKMQDAKIKIVFATQQLLGTGFDEPLLSVVHLTTPIRVKHKTGGALAQYIGRIMRIHPEKKESKIFDYVDYNERILNRSANSRRELYNRFKIKKL